jgi:hypothetical protein
LTWVLQTEHVVETNNRPAYRSWWTVSWSQLAQ